MSPQTLGSHRKTRIHLRWHAHYYSLCWAEFLKDKSFSVGINSRNIRFDEYGSAVSRGAQFTDHLEADITAGNVSIRDAKDHHVTFHPPRLNQRSGIIHLVASNGKVDEWPLDWFPVAKPQPVLRVTVADVDSLGQRAQPKRPYSIVAVPSNVRSLRMELCLHPRATPRLRLHNPTALANIHGFSPDYIASFYIFKDDSHSTCMYIATDTYVSKSVH